MIIIGRQARILLILLILVVLIVVWFIECWFSNRLLIFDYYLRLYVYGYSYDTLMLTKFIPAIIRTYPFLFLLVSIIYWHFYDSLPIQLHYYTNCLWSSTE